MSKKNKQRSIFYRGSGDFGAGDGFHHSVSQK